MSSYAFFYVQLQCSWSAESSKIVRSFNLPIIGVHHMEAYALVARYGNERTTQKGHIPTIRVDES